MSTLDLLNDLFDLEHTEHSDLFQSARLHLWEILDESLAAYLETRQSAFRQQFRKERAALGAPQVSPSAVIGDQVVIGPGTVIEPFVHIKGPAIIGRNCTIRSTAYLRENVIIGDGGVVGHGTEVKNALLFDEVEVPHRNYVGDSILGWKAHLGANVIISNVRLDKRSVRAKVREQLIDTKLRKFGALIGDRTEVGSNGAISPGTIIGKECIIYPNATVNRFMEPRQILRVKQEQRILKRRS